MRFSLSISKISPFSLWKGWGGERLFGRKLILNSSERFTFVSVSGISVKIFAEWFDMIIYKWNVITKISAIQMDHNCIFLNLRSFVINCG